MALILGVWLASPMVVLLPVKETKVSVLYDASSALEQVLMFNGEQKISFLRR